MKKAEINYEKAVALFEKKYDEALTNPQVRKPLSYALYHTWAIVSQREEER